MIETKIHDFLQETHNKKQFNGNILVSFKDEILHMDSFGFANLE